MGNFFSSPQQRAAESLFSAAESGRPIGASYLQQQYGAERSRLQAETSNRLGGVSGDILSRTASAGFAPGSGVEGLISKATQPILAGEQSAEAQLGAAEQSQLLQMIMSQLQMGFQGLPSSSPFGDILGSLTTLGNVVGGVGGLLRGLRTPASIISGGSSDGGGSDTGSIFNSTGSQDLMGGLGGSYG